MNYRRTNETADVTEVYAGADLISDVMASPMQQHVINRWVKKQKLKKFVPLFTVKQWHS